MRVGSPKQLPALRIPRAAYFTVQPRVTPSPAPALLAFCDRIAPAKRVLASKGFAFYCSGRPRPAKREVKWKNQQDDAERGEKYGVGNHGRRERADADSEKSLRQHDNGKNQSV